ncbi:DNA polymerase III subunit delta [Rhodobacteraceae bacterium NNCM2]|nr:DNA polymerase III subunit delta [Coraliihabitans acroporae]
MKLTGGAADGFLRKPDQRLFGALIHGPDPGLLAIKRRDLVSTLTEGDDLRLTQLDPAATSKNPAELDVALKSRGFFPGRRVVLVDGAKDGFAKAIEPLLATVTAEDAFLVVTATGLNARSALRKLFEGNGDLVALAYYPNALSPDEVSYKLRTAGLSAPLAEGGLADLTTVIADLDPGNAAQLIEKIATSFLNRDDEISLEELHGQLPLTGDAEIETLVDCVVDGRPAEVGPVMQRLRAGGTSPVQIMIFTSRRFRDLLGLSASPDGIEAGINRMRPPVFGPRRQRVASQARMWGSRVEEACRLLFATERQLRSSGDRPDMAIVERCLLRLAMMGSQSR